MDLLQTLFDGVWGTIRTIQKGGRWIRNKYSSQVQAQINPYSTCFSHCTCWQLQNLEPYFFGSLTPDQVTQQINGPQYVQFARNHPRIGAWGLAKFRGNLNQLWDVQERYVNDRLAVAGSLKRVFFSEATSIDMVKKGLETGSVTVNTSPVYRRQRLGHIMEVVGYSPDQDQWTIDDPFGDFRTGYSSGNIGKGDDIPSPVSEFEAIRGGMALLPRIAGTVQ